MWRHCGRRPNRFPSTSRRGPDSTADANMRSTTGRVKSTRDRRRRRTDPGHAAAPCPRRPIREASRFQGFDHSGVRPVVHVVRSLYQHRQFAGLPLRPRQAQPLTAVRTTTDSIANSSRCRPRRDGAIRNRSGGTATGSPSSWVAVAEDAVRHRPDASAADSAATREHGCPFVGAVPSLGRPSRH